MDIRTKRIIKDLDIKKQGLEIGPLTNPILSKSIANIYYLDHLSTSDLKKKYKHEPVELDDIVSIDYVLQNNDLKKTLGSTKFDYVIASHVIEHIPDMLGWLDQIGTILNPGGVLSLVIPDKRYTFDISRRLSTPADILGANLDKLTRFSSSMMYDFASECKAELDVGRAWNDREAYLNSKTRWSKSEAYDMCVKNVNGNYIDCHCHVFTPRSFMNILKKAIEHDLLDYEINNYLDTQQGELEFYVQLKKVSKTTSAAEKLKSFPMLANEKNKEEILNEEIDKLNQELALVYGSISWKITRRLRALRRLVR